MLYMVMLSFLPMFLWLIPIKHYGFLYTLLRSLSFNGTILDEGIFIAFTGLLIFLAVKQMTVSRNDKPISIVPALVVGFASVILIPTAGFSLTAGVFTILALFGVMKNTAYRYALVMSVPVLLVMGIIEAATSKYSAGVIEIILGIVISVIAAFLCTRLLKFIIKKQYLGYFAYYDLGLGVLAAIIGAIQLIVRN